MRDGWEPHYAVVCGDVSEELSILAEMPEETANSVSEQQADTVEEAPVEETTTPAEESGSAQTSDDDTPEAEWEEYVTFDLDEDELPPIPG